MENEVLEQPIETQTQVQETPSFSMATFAQPINEPIVQEQQLQEVIAEQSQVELPTEQLIEEGTASFIMPSFGQEELPTESTSTPTQSTLSWKDEIKKIDRKELLKEAGLSDFAIEFAEYYESGQDPYKFLEAKSFDWNKVSDIDVIKKDYKSQYPTFDDSQIERLIGKKYGIVEGGDEENEDALLMIKADAHLSRESKIKEQQSFKIPTVSQPQEAAEALEFKRELEQRQQQIQQEYQSQVEFYNSHEATQSLVQSKRVGVDVGLDKPFFFSVDKPELVTKAITDGDLWRRITAKNPQEADSSKLIPDVAKMQKLVIATINPNYEKDLVNYGKSMGLKAVLEEGQNAKRPLGVAPTVPNDSPQMAWGRATEKKFGG